ncbi:SGNH/GDSL hydrolase family protein [Egicoccus halophilus]|uniref:SGNH hydrolase-type esterase domain-containing protein n=1 Tax=Egicoccus halophilus TaxID=1670830 RepID=A0A8J3EVT0_9ACTN|nr:GDSL-type esterase/lipase family protein [Egicoccus halophilus]GGI09796.1 hypothetical protein GCM10011354_35850 [Egicoccus halophilus]
MTSLRRLLAPTAVLALLLAGCDDGSADDVSTTDAPVPDAPTGELDAPAEDTGEAIEDDAAGGDEPDGDDDASAGSAGTIDYVALGDSLATGAGATTSYVEEYAELVRDDTGADVEVTNFAVDGWTSQDLLSSLQDDDGVQAALADADLVTLDIGGNDLLRVLPTYLSGNCGGEDELACLRDAAERFAERFDDILDEVAALVGDDTDVRTLDLYVPFAGDPRVGEHLDRLRPTLDEVNETILRAADARGVTVAEVHDAFHGEDGLTDPVDEGLISVDGLHPSNDGHQLIAEQLVALGPVTVAG